MVLSIPTIRKKRYVSPAGSLQDYAFNAKGQRTRSLVATQSASLSWSGERLASLETSGTHADYTYDASGMRIKTRLASQGKEQTLRYVYDELRLYEVASSGDEEFIIGYLYEDTNQTPTSASYETSGTCVPFSLESNVRGDVVALRDTDGEVFARYIYSEYGVLKNLRTNATALIDEPLADKIAHNQPLRYAGYVYDEYSQMYYCSARYYDPATQVFVSIDPARADAERSGYLYCGGDPVNSTDPSGLWEAKYHRHMTYLCAKAVGFKEYAAINMKKGAYDLDNFATCALNAPGLHFNQNSADAGGNYKTIYTAEYGLVKGGDTRAEYYGEVRQIAVDIMKGHSLKNKTTVTSYAAHDFGMGLHALQDSYSHGNILPLNHQIPRWCADSWDDKEFRPSRKERAKKYTKSKMKKFKKATRG